MPIEVEAVCRSGIVADGTVAQDSAQAGAIWTLRESISDGLRHRGAVASDHHAGAIATLLTCTSVAGMGPCWRAFRNDGILVDH